MKRKEKDMFGYVKPHVPELLVKEYDFYRATYCGICRAMKDHTGSLSRITLSYDSVFLALVRMLYIPKEQIDAEKCRCILHPVKKRAMLKENDALIYTAKAFAILTHHKVEDDIADEGLKKRVLANAVSPITSHAVAVSGMTELSSLAKEKLSAISKLEEEKTPSVDLPARLFGELLGEIFAFGLEGNDRLVTYECGAALGRFIYAADAAEDYYKDRKSGSYNPYVIQYGGKDLTADNKATIKCALIHECKNIERAIDLMPFDNRETIENILKNIIYLGLPKRISFLDGEPTEKPKNGEII
jgi:hypothetical protein